jgi:glutathione S-transferase
MPPEPLTLVTFAPMIDSEFSRLLLRYYDVRYREERHLFGPASVVALWRGWTPQVPVLAGGGLRLAGPRAIADHFDMVVPPGRALVPARQPLRTRVEADWDRFNGILASETAAFAYFHLLPHQDIMMEPFSRGLPVRQTAALQSWAYGPMRQLLTLLLRLSPTRAADALLRIRSAFDHTDRVLEDGRRYMTGETLTLSDFALVSAVAPLLLPPGYAAPMAPLEAMPAAMVSVVSELRAHPTARFVQRIYAGHAPAA